VLCPLFLLLPQIPRVPQEEQWVPQEEQWVPQEEQWVPQEEQWLHPSWLALRAYGVSPQPISTRARIGLQPPLQAGLCRLHTSSALLLAFFPDAASVPVRDDDQHSTKKKRIRNCAGRGFSSEHLATRA